MHWQGTHSSRTCHCGSGRIPAATCVAGCPVRRAGTLECELEADSEARGQGVKFEQILPGPAGRALGELEKSGPGGVGRGDSNRALTSAESVQVVCATASDCHRRLRALEGGRAY